MTTAELESILTLQTSDIPFEEDILEHWNDQSCWIRYLNNRRDVTPLRRFWLYERALEVFPASYKLWYAYLVERITCLKARPKLEEEWKGVIRAFERSLMRLHMMPRIWLLYATLCTTMGLITVTRNVLDRALASLPVLQHDRIWEVYLVFLNEPYVPLITAIAAWRAYTRFDPTALQDYLAFLESRKAAFTEDADDDRPSSSALSAQQLLSSELIPTTLQILDARPFVASGHLTRLDYYRKLCRFISENADVATQYEPVLHAACLAFRTESGQLWAWLIEHHVRAGAFSHAYDAFSEALSTMTSISDFSIVWDTYMSVLKELALMRCSTDEDRSKVRSWIVACQAASHHCGGMDDQLPDIPEIEDDPMFSSSMPTLPMDLLLARIRHLWSQYAIYKSNIRLRASPNDVAEWHDRISLFDDFPDRQAVEFGRALTTIQADATTASQYPHTIWTRFAYFWGSHHQMAAARKTFEKALTVRFASPSHLIAVWVAYIEWEILVMEVEESAKLASSEGEGGEVEATTARDTAITTARNQDAPMPNHIRTLIERATYLPKHILSIIKERRLQGNYTAISEGDVEDDSHVWVASLSPRLWSLRLDLEMSYGTLETVKSVLSKIWLLPSVPTVRMVLSMADYFAGAGDLDTAYRVYERGLELFPLPHAMEIWVPYLDSMVTNDRGANAQTERIRDLFERALAQMPPAMCALIYHLYISFEKAQRAPRQVLALCDRALAHVLPSERRRWTNFAILNAARYFGLDRVRQRFDLALTAFTINLEDLQHFAMRYAAIEVRLREVDRARAIYTYAAQFFDPRGDPMLWHTWRDFEEANGNVDTFKEMLRMRRSVLAEYANTIHPLLRDRLAKDLRDVQITADRGDAIRDAAPQEAKLPEAARDDVRIEEVAKASALDEDMEQDVEVLKRSSSHGHVTTQPPASAIETHVPKTVYGQLLYAGTAQGTAAGARTRLERLLPAVKMWPSSAHDESGDAANSANGTDNQKNSGSTS